MKVVALVGCPNVGKSTFFNRLTKTRDALVADFPGLTRDRKYGRAMYDGREYIVIDTGGIAEDADQPSMLTSRMTSQALLAIDECDLVLFMVDARAGVMPGDYAVADYIRRSGKACAIIANKVDGMDPDIAGTDFYALGLGEIYQTAVVHGRGVNVVLEEVIAPVLRQEGPLDSDIAAAQAEAEAAAAAEMEINIDVSGPLYVDKPNDAADAVDAADADATDIDADAAEAAGFVGEEGEGGEGGEDSEGEDADVDISTLDFTDAPEEEALLRAVADNAWEQSSMFAFDSDAEAGGAADGAAAAAQASAARTSGKAARRAADNSEWEQGFAFLDNVPVDYTGGGFDWHAFRENQRAAIKGENSEEQKQKINESMKTPFADLPIKFALIGKPNVGKSTLTNRLLGEERVVVADLPGTTRDSIYIPLEREGQKYIVIDTAGVRKRSKVSEAIEKFSIVKTLKAIEDCNVAVLVIDAREHITDQDLSLLGFIIDSGRSLVIAVNKWDGLTTDFKQEIKQELELRLGFVDFARVHFISALHGTGVGNLFASINEAYESATRRHSSSLLNHVLAVATREHEPPVSGGRRIKLKYAHAGGYNPPRIIIHGNKVSKMPDSYKRYLINCYRKALQIMGTPVILEFKEGENPYANVKPAQKRMTQSQMRAQKRQEVTERRYERSAQKAARAKDRAIAEAKRTGRGLVLKKGKSKASGKK